MGFITREQYIEKTLKLAEDSISEAFRAKYWELAGKALGYLESPKVENQNIAVFQSISGEMMAFIQNRVGDKSLLEDKVEDVLDEK